jgi:putative acetyltransferase
MRREKWGGSMRYKIEEITSKYDNVVCDVIKNVGIEFGAVGEGFGPADEEVLNMSKFYGIESRSIYLVALLDGKVVGGCGVSAFDGREKVCELRKLFLLPEARGLGVGKALTEKCLEFAKLQGYTECYLDTLSNMKAAIKLYERIGFKKLLKPLEGVIHTGCDVWMLKEL